MNKLGKAPTVDWSSISVDEWNPSENYEVRDVIMTIERHPSERNVNNSYDLERALLDMIGEKDFIHNVYRLNIFMVGTLYVEFTATSIRIGTGFGHRIPD